MGTCSSAPRMTVSLRTFMASNPKDALGEDWYFDTMNVLLDRWAHSHVQFLRKKFLEATGDEKELDKKGFFSLFAELQDMPKSVAESAFRMFDTDNSGKLNFREFCCALALCCQLMSSDDEKIRFVFDMFDTNDDGLLSSRDVQQLLEHALQREEEKYLEGEEKEDAIQKRQQRIAEIKQELNVSSSQQLSYDRFYEWAIRNMDGLNNLLCTFQIVPSPDRERSICEDILNRHPSLQEGSTWYCISHKWLQVWKAHAGWTGPSPGRRVPTASGLLGAPVAVAGEPQRSRDRMHGDSELPLHDFANEIIAGDDGTGEEIFLNELGHQTMTARPPEIDNSDLEGEHKGELKMNLVEHLDYELIPEEMWMRLVEWYGGGPAIPRKVICMGQDNQPQVELYPPLVLVVVAGKSGQPLPQFSRRFFISRQSTLGQTLTMLAEKLAKPAEKSRLWHRSKGEQWRLVEQKELSAVLDEFLEGKVWDAGAFLLETQIETGEWPRDLPMEKPTESEAEVGDERDGSTPPAAEAGDDLQHSFEVGDRVEARSGVTGAWMRGTIVDVVLRDQGSAPSQVKVHYDSTVYKSDEWINTSSDRLAPFGTHTGTLETVKTSEELPIPVRGATGLQNLGNTCFMNATIQCMVNTPLMREYFLSSQYMNDLNERGTSHCKGKLAQEFGKVTTDLWSGKSAVNCPRNLKRTIDQFAPQFAGYEQHDAQELLDFVLEGLHDDLNRKSVGGLNNSGRLVPRIRREQGTPKLFNNTKTLHGRSLPMSSPKRGAKVDGRQSAEEVSVSTESTATVIQSGVNSSNAPANEESDPWAAVGGFFQSHRGGLESQPDIADSGLDDDESRTLEGVDDDETLPAEVHIRGSSVEFRAVSKPQLRDRPASHRSATKPMQVTESTAPRTGKGASPEERMPGTENSQPGLGMSSSASNAAGMRRPEDPQSEEEPMVPIEPPAQTELSTIGSIMLLPSASKAGESAGGLERSEEDANVNSPEFTGAQPQSARLEAARKVDTSKRLMSSRWWSFAWRRGRGALDLPKDTNLDAQSEMSPAIASGKDSNPDAGQRGEVRAVMLGGSASSGPNALTSSPANSPPSTPASHGQLSAGEDFASASRAAAGSKTPSGSAGAAVVAARRGDDGTTSEDGMSLTYNESEDFVPELLTPATNRRSRSLFSWRRRKTEEDTGAMTPRRQPKMPPTMMPLREEQGDAVFEDEPRPGSADSAEATTMNEATPANSDVTPSGAIRSFLPTVPWRGTLRSREGSLERGADEADFPRDRETGSGRVGRTQVKGGDSLLPAFLRRAKSRENADRHRQGQPRSAPLPHQGDTPVPDAIAPSASADAEAVEPQPVPPIAAQSSIAAEGQAQAVGASTSLPFYFRSPWTRGNQTRSAPSTARDGAGHDYPQQDADVAEEISQSLDDAGVQVQQVGDATPKEPPEEDAEVDEDSLPDEEKAALIWERYRARNRSLIVDVFEGQARSQLTCCRCGNSSSTFEPFRYLSVPIPSNHMDQCSLRVVFFPVPSSPSERPRLTRFTVTVPKSSTVQRVEQALSSRLPVPMSSVLLAEVYRSRIHRYLDPNLPLSDVRAEDQLFAFEVLQKSQDLLDYQEQLAPSKIKKDRIADPTKQPQFRVLMIQAMHRRVVDVCRSDGRTWAQRREVFGLPFVMSAVSSWTYATLHEMLMIHAARFFNPRKDSKTNADERQVPFVARIVNASGAACGACDRRNCTGCLLPKGSAKLRLRAGLLTGAVSTAKIYLALDWVDSSMYDQEYVDSVTADDSLAAEDDNPSSNGTEASASVPLSACIDAFAQAEYMKVENGNGVKCEKCDIVVDAVKRIEIWREPDVLLFHIKRFHFSGEHFEKISTNIEVPSKDLDIRSWIVGPTGSSSTPYDLYGVACHTGGMSGGHYTSYCLNDGGKEPTWLKFNDETVTLVDLVQELPTISKECYVLFYRKRAFSSSNLITYQAL